MKRLLTPIAALAAIGIGLSGCGGVTNGTAALPPTTQSPLNYGKLTFAVGTATLQDGTTGLNVVAFLRQPNGDSAYLVDSPNIAGPTGFTVPNNAATAGNSDAGTSNITSTPQTQTTSTTFGTTGGLFGGGLGPFNAVQGGSNKYPGNPPPYPTPMYGIGTGAGAPVQLLIGQPIEPNPIYNIDYPPGFAGWLPGFTAFEAAPVAGTYTMNVTVATANAGNTTITGSGTLASAAAVLGATAAPTVTKDGGGGFSAINFTAPAGTVESVAFVENTSSGYFFSVETKGAGPQSASLGDNFGGCGTAGARSLCTTSTSTGPSFFAGENYSITVVSFDYGDVEASPPNSTSQSPSLGLGANGQADISISPATSGTY
jgi:hypothetical protein